MDQELNPSAPQEPFNESGFVENTPVIPAVTEETPVAVNETPAATEETPAVKGEETPTVVEEAVPAVEEAPAVVEEAPVTEETPAAEEAPVAVDYATLSMDELIAEFERLLDAEDKTELHKNAEVIKSCFYKLLHKRMDDQSADVPETAAEEPAESEEETQRPETTEEITFKRLYARYKSLRAELMRTLEQQKEKNLEVKLAIIEEIKTLLEKQEDINHTFPEFRALQLRWKEVGPVPLARTKDVWDTYQHYVEKFYDYVKINNELRDLDFRQNLELKEQICAKAEALVQDPSIISAFHKLQKLHEEWREIGPIARDLRESVWERFKASTTAINKRHQEYFEEQKKKQKDNFDAKTVLCEKAEAIATEPSGDGNSWNKRAKALEDLQKEWRTIGFASKRENQKVYDRFRAACDAFYAAKREYYSGLRGEIQENLAKKIAICEMAEQLNQSEDWRKTTDQLINLQKQWKEIGVVPRKQADAIWKRFRAACDLFFSRKSAHFSNVDASYDDNLKAKEAVLKQLEAFDPSEVDDVAGALKEIQAKWNAIGFVPIKDKDRIQAAFKALMDQHFGNLRARGSERRGPRPQGRGGKVDEPRSGRDKLIQRFRQLEQDITVWENNMGFFAKSKNADKILADTRQKIEEAKQELAQLEEKIKQLDNQYE